MQNLFADGFARKLGRVNLENRRVKCAAMLPDFVSVKKELSEARSDAVSSNLFGDPVLDKIQSYRQHEGNRFTIFRRDGSHVTSNQQMVRSELITFDPKDIQARGEESIYESIGRAHQQVAAIGRRMISQTLEEDAVPKIDGGGRRFDADVYFEILESMDFNFDEDGKWTEPDFWQERPNPQTQLTVKRTRMKIDSEPALLKRLDSLVARKRQEWDDREANRKLVD